MGEKVPAKQAMKMGKQGPMTASRATAGKGRKTGDYNPAYREYKRSGYRKTGSK